MELFIFARFHARAGQENTVEQARGDVAGPSRRELGCVGLHVFRFGIPHRRRHAVFDILRCERPPEARPLGRR
jgi:hypothetical protein